MRINPEPPTSWQDLQEQVALILTECKLSAEIEQSVTTARGTVSVDVVAVDLTQNPTQSYLCECKYWSKRISKDVVHSFRTVVADYGANSGLLISSAEFQKGAYEAASFSNVKLLTWDHFEQLWTARWIEHYLRPRLYEAHEVLSDYMEPLLDDEIIRRADALPV
ncbi:MAG: restriction endonuclease [Planctomycetaceae bacterium]|nr:restriction endonuclease [Planctomycetaceae bacterium]